MGVCGCGFCNVWVCLCGFCKVWVCVCIGFVMCGCLVICLPVFTVFYIVCTVFLYCFDYVYYLFCLYWCKDYCHRVKTQTQQIIIIIITGFNSGENEVQEIRRLK